MWIWLNVWEVQTSHSNKYAILYHSAYSVEEGIYTSPFEWLSIKFLFENFLILKNFWEICRTHYHICSQLFFSAQRVRYCHWEEICQYPCTAGLSNKSLQLWIARCLGGRDLHVWSWCFWSESLICDKADVWLKYLVKLGSFKTEACKVFLSLCYMKVLCCFF